MAWVALDQGTTEGVPALLEESLRLLGELGDRRNAAYLLEGWASLAAALSSAQPKDQHGSRERAQRAARLFGAAGAVRTASGIPLPPVDRWWYERYLATARAQLDERSWEAAWAEGQAMTLEQAIAYALEETSAA